MGRDERAEAPVEDLVGERGGAAVQAELGAVADAAQPGAQADLTRLQQARGLRTAATGGGRRGPRGGASSERSFRDDAQPTTRVVTGRLIVK
jgi:hypothetical protein